MTVELKKSSDIQTQLSTIVDLLNHRAQFQSEQIAYTYLRHGESESLQLTYLQLDRQARAVASQLQQLELAGSRALLLYPPGLDFIIGWFGCLYAGVIAVPAYPPRRNQNLSRLQAIVTNAQASVALSTTALVTNLKTRLANHRDLSTLPWLATDEISPELAALWEKPPINSDTIAFLQYTSGSTGTPKGVMVSHGNLWHNLASIYHCFGHSSNSRGVIWLPPYHDMGLIGGVLQPLFGGFPVTLMSSVDFLQKPLRWLEAISRLGATTSGGPNFAYELCTHKIKSKQLASLDLSSWEVAFTGAEPIRAQTLEKFAATFEACGFRREAFYPCYGMAEATLIVSGGLQTAPPVIESVDGAALEQHRVVMAEPTREGQRQIVGCGQSLPDQKVIIVDPETKLECGVEKIGEVWVSGPSVARGYWNLPDETAQTFEAYLADTGSGPFLRTGDLGFIRQGELYITGRIKDVIIIRGQNHYASDIELTVEKSHPALRPGCGAAFGVEIQGQERLVVVQEVERSYLRKLEPNEVVAQLRQSVAAQHGLQVYAAVLLKPGSIPKTSSGKIRRYACRELFLEGSLNVVSNWSENPQGQVKFWHLCSEVDSLLHKLQTK